MKRKFILRKIVVALSTAFALGGSFIPTNAFASGSALGDCRMASGANVIAATAFSLLTNAATSGTRGITGAPTTAPWSPRFELR
jgi:hypothetical protein